MEYVKPKVHDETNYYYGVDINDKKAVKREFLKRKAGHTLITLIMLALIGFLGFVAFDYYRVMELEGKPIFAIKKKIDNGVMYQGIGYKVLYCDNDERYIGSVLYKSCTETDGVVTFEKVLYDSLVEFMEEKEIISKSKVETITMNSYTVDGKNDKDGEDYLIDLSIVCKGGKDNCIDTDINFPDPLNFKLIFRFDKYNHAYDLVYFKTEGLFYDSLIANYQDKVKQYYIDNNLVNLDNLRLFEVRLTKRFGFMKFRGTQYNDAYSASISFLCVDGTNTCVKQTDKEDNEGDYANLYFLASIFIDADDNVVLVGPKEYLQ